MAVLFLDLLRHYLREVEIHPRAPARASRPAIDLPAARRYFLEAAEASERREPGASPKRGRPTSAWEWLYYERSELDSFLLFVASELDAGLCAGSDAEALQAHVHQAVRVLCGLPAADLSRVRERELQRVVEQASEAVENGGGIEDIARYALEVRAVRKSASGVAVSGIGRVLLGVPETDAVRWLLTIEALQSMGPDDEWRTPRDALEEILRWPPNKVRVLRDRRNDDGEGPWAEEHPWSFSVAALSRLKALGVLTQPDKRDWWRVYLAPGSRPILEEVVSQRRTPLSMLAESLIAEERGTLSGHATAAVPLSEPAAEVQARHARMVVHELRNALVPVRMALTGIYRALDPQGAGAWQPQQERIDRGLDRVFRFVDELQKVVQLAALPAEPFDAVAAIHDAIKGLNGGLPIDLQIPTTGPLPRLLGHRERFTLAIVNILRNAAQSSVNPRVVVRLEAVPLRGGGHLVLTIEDDGPGVPEEHRERIFQQGFALRQGGSGQGLALVREVVEVEMKGRVRCEQGDLGGARFVLMLPMPVKESP